MSFTFERYYHIVILIVSLIILIDNSFFWNEICLFLLINSLSLFVVRKKHYYKIPLIFLLGTFFGGVVFRSYMIYSSTISYRYFIKHGLDNVDIIETALQDAIVGLALIVLGYIMVALFAKQRKSTASNTSNTIKLPALVSNFYLIISVLLVLIGIKLFIHLGLGIGLKTIRPTSYIGFLFLLRLIPDELPFVILVLYFFKYGNLLSFYKKLFLITIGGAMAFAILVTGSKVFVLYFGLSAAVYAFYMNYKIKLRTFLIVSSVAVLLVGVSFILAEFVKFNVNKNEISISEGSQIFAEVVAEVDPYLLLGQVSMRFSGMDGQILLFQSKEENLSVDWENLEKSYYPSTIAANILEALIPGINFTNIPFSGQAIGFYVLNYKPGSKQVFAGALGLFGSIKMITRSNQLLYYLILVLWGVITGFYFMLISKIKNTDIIFVLFFFGCFLVLNNTISGNFDTLLGKFIVKIVLLFFYTFLVLILRDIFRTKNKSKQSYNLGVTQ